MSDMHENERNERPETGHELLQAITRLTRDVKRAAKTLSPDEARFLVDTYYAMQGNRIRAANQVRALTASGEPHETLSWLTNNAEVLERDIKSALDSYSSASPVGTWAKSICGIGPVISAGLLAHIDIQRNASLKRLCWIIGESFVKVSSNKNDFYGKIYLTRKAYEEARNEAGGCATQAAEKLAKFKIDKSTDAYKAYAAGKLPPGHIHARAKRYATKLFLSHYQAVAYRSHYGVEAPRPYILTQEAGHAHEITCPNWPF